MPCPQCDPDSDTDNPTVLKARNFKLRADLAAAKALLREARDCLNEADGAYSYRYLIAAIEAAIAGDKG